MRLTPNGISLSASDLANHLSCRHLSSLDQAAAEGRIDAPHYEDPALEVLQERGFRHEAAYLEHLSGRGLGVHRLDRDEDGGTAFERTQRAMREGHDIIVQSTLLGGRWYGRADVLRKVPVASDLGDYSYEVIDTKLARETRAGTILQLCLYSDLLGRVQGRPPDYAYVVAPGETFEEQAYRLSDFLAYYRFVRSRLEETVDRGGDPNTYPDPVEHCDICRWWQQCDRRRRGDDHLCLVAGLSTLQARELAPEVATLEALATADLAGFRPKRGSRDGYVRVHEQARVQKQGRDEGAPVYELLDREPEADPPRGFHRLPAPDPGDVFFDIESDPFVGLRGLEYLFGHVTAEEGAPYVKEWALTPERERRMFEQFVDFLMARWAEHPEMHVYHFGHYEPTALKRLMGVFATREDEIDRMLRAGFFVNLHTIVKESLRASVEQYSIKDLEQFYRYPRKQELREASLHRHAVERALELGDHESITDELRDVVERYNRDDCVSTLKLRNWLEELRQGLVDAGEEIPRPVAESGDPTERLSAELQEINDVAERLTVDVPELREDRTGEQHARWLLANLLAYFRREDKAPWWEYFRLRELSEEELLDERQAIAGLEFVEDVSEGRKTIHRYRYPRQDTSVRTGTTLKIGETTVGEVVDIYVAARIVDVRKTRKMQNEHPAAAFGHDHVSGVSKGKALLRLAYWVLENGMEADGPYRAVRYLLLNRLPSVGNGRRLQREAETTVEAARRLVVEIDGDVLAIQGPPGAGKTFTGARMILDAVRAGKRVGVTAVGHKVIRKLLEDAIQVGREASIDIAAMRKIGSRETVTQGGIREVEDNDSIIAALNAGEVQVGAGTTWMWSRKEYDRSVDVLFVDEAGQLCLADVVAAGMSARSIVLLGDPQQLEQPQQGSHPEGTDRSALEHLLDRAATMPPERGLFLSETWRLAPAIAKITSELFYDGRLDSHESTAQQTVSGSKDVEGAGFRFVPVAHEGNQSSSSEEVEVVAELVSALADGARWVDRRGAENPIVLDDILVIAPYNAQVADLTAALPEGARVGTVDRFQGQEAPVVIYSTATSSPADAPRGMEFLYNLNRLNVATSRARCVCIIVGNPALFEPECKTPKQMRLANALCRVGEAARVSD